jgi:pyruvate dehydrogenase E1 component alpha subunit
VIARGAELGPVLAEIIGRTTGYNRGRGGTFHVIAPHLGILQTSGVVGGCMPLAAGAAFSAKKRGTEQISLVFFGDGVLEEGAFYETINMAALWKLPIIFLCENNGVERELRKGGPCPSSSLSAKQLTDISNAFSIPSVVVDGCDIEAVHAAVADAVTKVRGGAGPAFIETRITRWPGNAGTFPALVGGDYRIEWIFSPASAPKELQEWLQESDPVALFARSLGKVGGLSERDITALDEDVRSTVAAAVRFALESPAPKAEAALEHVFA